jgi:hypothetical protein
LAHDLAELKVARHEDSTPRLDEFAHDIGELRTMVQDLTSQIPTAAVTPTEKPVEVPKSKDFPVSRDAFAREGIMDHFFSLTEDDPSQDPEWIVTASSTASEKRDRWKALAKFQNQDQLATNEDPHRINQWVCYELNRHTIEVIAYTIRCKRGDPFALKQWIVEGSMDARKWTMLDERDDPGLYPLGMKLFDVETPIECKFIRLPQTGPTQLEKCAFQIHRLELYGKVYPPPRPLVKP